MFPEHGCSVQGTEHLINFRENPAISNILERDAIQSNRIPL
jgi:hypothetical protein